MKIPKIEINLTFTVMFCFLNYLVGHMDWNWLWLTLFIDLTFRSEYGWRK